MDWRSFMYAHERALVEGSPFELLFAKTVLAKVEGLSPTEVRHQYPFRDDDGKPRRMDFAIVAEPGINIAIEVDGYDKVGRGSGMTPQEFEDFLHRGSSLSRQGWTVLRFANSRVKRHPKECARQIELTLKEARRRAGVLAMASHSARVHEPVGHKSDSERKELKQLETENAQAIAEIKSQLEQELRVATFEHTEASKMWWLAAIAAALLVVGLIVVVAKTQTHTDLDAGALEAGSSCNAPVSWDMAANYVGKVVAVQGPLVKARPSGSTSRLVYLNLGHDFPHPRFVFQTTSSSMKAAQAFESRQVCASGRVFLQKSGTPAIQLRSLEDIQVK